MIAAVHGEQGTRQELEDEPIGQPLHADERQQRAFEPHVGEQRLDLGVANHYGPIGVRARQLCARMASIAAAGFASNAGSKKSRYGASSSDFIER